MCAITEGTSRSTVCAYVNVYNPATDILIICVYIHDQRYTCNTYSSYYISIILYDVHSFPYAEVLLLSTILCGETERLSRHCLSSDTRFNVKYSVATHTMDLATREIRRHTHIHRQLSAER